MVASVLLTSCFFLKESQIHVDLVLYIVHHIEIIAYGRKVSLLGWVSDAPALLKLGSPKVGCGGLMKTESSYPL